MAVRPPMASAAVARAERRLEEPEERVRPALPQEPADRAWPRAMASSGRAPLIILCMENHEWNIVPLSSMTSPRRKLLSGV
jgi:hypothetical protein